MSTSLLLEVAPEIDTNPTSFYRLCPWTPLGAPPPDRRYRLVLPRSPCPGLKPPKHDTRLAPESGWGIPVNLIRGRTPCSRNEDESLLPNAAV